MGSAGRRWDTRGTCAYSRAFRTQDLSAGALRARTGKAPELCTRSTTSGACAVRRAVLVFRDPTDAEDGWGRPSSRRLGSAFSAVVTPGGGAE